MSVLGSMKKSNTTIFFDFWAEMCPNVFTVTAALHPPCHVTTRSTGPPRVDGAPTGTMRIYCGAGGRWRGGPKTRCRARRDGGGRPLQTGGAEGVVHGRAPKVGGAVRLTSPRNARYRKTEVGTEWPAPRSPGTSPEGERTAAGGRQLFGGGTILPLLTSVYAPSRARFTFSVESMINN